MLELSPDEFEEFVADVWAARGYETVVTQSSNDAGKDVVAKQNGRQVGIQAKRYRPSNRMGGPEIQQYGSLLHDETIDEVVIVTSSTFTNAAYRRAQEIGVELVDGERLLTLADRYQGEGTATGSSSTSSSGGGSGSSSSQSGLVALFALPFQLAFAFTVYALKVTVWFTSVALKLTVAYFVLILKLVLWPFQRGGKS